jgi:drug/metabolite transporter (DMT)-like permease
VTWLSYIATGLVLSGVYFIAQPRLRGQWIMLGADLTWLTYSIITGQYALTLQSLVLISLAVKAIKNWNREGIKF